ncbi:MAG: DUF4358 domain-containing protein [Clostridia bacterium]|nr:DUF4358 domain-containing protein [Clostridia bacterium]MBR6479061.1 DUF4358 domain-containing protein [Clostridia bacterium]MBR6511951.1 DUF4358 domain-containing protein [Clostridia bacterium]
MKKLFAILLVLSMALTFAACSGGSAPVAPTTAQTGSDGDVDIGAVYMAIAPLFKDNEPREHDADFIENIYGISKDLIKDSACVTYDMGDYAFSGEIVMIEATDKDAAATVKEALEKRLDDMKKQLSEYEGASIDNELANRIEVIQRGNCVAFFYSDQYDAMAEAFNK